MDYKYQRSQIFGKKLRVPKYILNKVYNCTLSFNEFIEYKLDDKIPVSCMTESDRRIVEKFGIDKCKELDWELINKIVYYNNDYINFRNLLMTIDPSTEDINTSLYELVKNQIKPRDYSPKMREKYSDRLFDISQNENKNFRYLINSFNDGKVSLKEIVHNWDLFKDKDLSYCLLNDDANKNHITDSDLKQFMTSYGILAPLIIDNNDIYTFINEITALKNEEEKQEYIKYFTDDILSNTHRKYGDYRPPIPLTDNEYKEIFKYSSIEDYLKLFNYGNIPTSIMKELETLPKDYIFNMSIPFTALLNYHVLSFIGIYGLKNVVEFDNECGHFFSKNNCEMLKLMFDMYLHYGRNEHNPNRTIYTKKNYDENGSYIDRPYTKDEFYEAMKRMIIYGPSNWNYRDKAPDYRSMTGEFRVRNSELFISEQAPEELQKLFYTKSITPRLLVEHPEYIEYLNGKDLSSCFKTIEIQVKGSNTSYDYENFYKFLGRKTNFNGIMNFIIEYSDILDIVFGRRMAENYQYEIKFSMTDDFSQIQKKIDESFKKLIIEKRLIYPKNIPKNLIENYSAMFLSSDAPQELQESFYNRTINSEFILSNQSYRKFLKDVDLEILFKFMPVSVMSAEHRYGQINLVSAIKQTFGLEKGFDVMLLYEKYIESVFEVNKLQNFKYNPNFSQNGLLNELDKVILQTIIDGKIKYDESIPSHFKTNNPTLFLSKNIPQDIRNKFYNREFALNDFNTNPELLEIFENTNIVCGVSENMSWMIPLFNNSDNLKIANFNRLKVISTYSKIHELNLQRAFKQYITKHLEDFNIQNIEEFEYMLNNLKNYETNEKYIANIKNKNIKDLFEELLEILSYSNSSWIVDLFRVSNTISYMDVFKIISLYETINDYKLQNAFKEYVMEFVNNIEIEKIEYVSEVLSRLSLSNSSEIFTFRKELATQILKSTNPLENLSKIEDIFIRNNIPTIGKVYSCFEILHPNFQGFNFDSSMISPVLKRLSTTNRKIVVFSDLIKASFGSNNRSVNSYLRNIEIGSNLYESIKSGQFQYNTLSETVQKELITFSRHLSTLYNNTMKAKEENETFTSTENVLTDILELSKKLSPDGTLDYNLGDRVIRMFCGFAGIDTLEQAKEYIRKKVQTADLRNRNTSNTEMILEEGDFIKGIGDITYLRNILQNGSVSTEFLGSSAGSDATPLDTDVSRIMSSGGTIRDKIEATAASSYGPIWFVLKNDDRFMTTRNNSETFDAKRDMSKMEVFYTGILGQGHYGIRTGFASSEINYIVMENYDPRVGLEIAMNGFYIPIANKEGKIIFTPNDYDNLREKMSGLSYYGEENYLFSENLVTEETEYFKEQIEQNNYEVQVKRTKINEIIKKSLDELGLHLKTNIDGDLTEGFVELIDTGSTGRGTNRPDDGDFDFMMRLDRRILSDSSKLSKLKQTILKNLGKENSSELTRTGDFRLKSVQIDDEISVDIDITFTEKTDKVSYSTDMALQDRLSTIKKIDPDKYKYVVANILLAKQVLKKAEAYKPNRGEIPQGGLGGVGIENWILQNGGSFIDAARSFVDASFKKSFSEFQSSYQIWDFGDNHLAEKKGQYSHDNFVSNNMSEAGYQKTVQALKEYLKSMEFSQNIKL